MKIFLLVSLLGTALASPGGLGLAYGSYSTAYGPLARASLAYGAYAAPAYAAHGSLVASSPVAAYAAAAPAVATYAAAAPAVATYAAAAPAVATYAAAAPAVATYAAAAPAVASYATAVPATAVVPVAKVSAQPAVVQNVVDVAQPKLATRRYEIRRPAIQKQFYDIEERVVVRPAGSAVVELETPIGANQRGPTQIRPAAPPVALQSVQSVHPAHQVSHFLPTAPVAVAGNHQYEIVEHTQETQEISQQQIQQLPAQIPQQPIPQQPIPQPSFPQQDAQQQQFDDSDSVSIDNPEISVRTGRPPLAPQNLPSPLFRSQLPQIPRAESSLPQFSINLEQLRSRGDEISVPSFSRSRISQYLQPESPFQQAVSSQSPPLARAQPTPRPDFIARQQQESDLIRNQLPAFRQLPQASLRQGPISQLRSEGRFEARSFEGETVISSARNLSPEQSQANQARLIDLLTARGPVSEVRSPSDAVRGRVISATPAPLGAGPADERVNTRRVVVNRPIQTVQEVDVVEPFTKLERVAVQQPAVIKSAHVELAAVPAAVPAVHSVTVAPHYYKK